MFRTVPLSIIRGFFTVHTAMVYIILKISQMGTNYKCIHVHNIVRIVKHVVDKVLCYKKVKTLKYSILYNTEFYLQHVLEFKLHFTRIYSSNFYPFVKFQYDIYHCCVYSEKLLMMDRGTVRNM